MQCEKVIYVIERNEPNVERRTGRTEKNYHSFKCLKILLVITKLMTEKIYTAATIE